MPEVIISIHILIRSIRFYLREIISIRRLTRRIIRIIREYPTSIIRII